MAIDATTYSIDQFKFAILAETESGTANTTSMHLVNVDKPIAPSDNVFIDNSPRLGTGRTLKTSDHYATEKGQVKSITVSGLADKTTFAIMAENCIGIAESSGTIDVPYNFTGAEVTIGQSGLSDNIHTLTVAIVSPVADKTRLYPGCIVSNLSWVDDCEAEGGRRRFSATFQTRANPTNSTSDPTYANSTQLYTTYYDVWDYCGANGIVQVGGSDAVLAKLEVSINSNPRWHGGGTNGVAQTAFRGGPIIDITGNLTVKYDDNTLDVYQDYADGDSVVVQALDHSTIASATQGIKAEYTKISGDVNVEAVNDGAFVSIPFQCSGSTSGNIAQIPV